MSEIRGAGKRIRFATIVTSFLMVVSGLGLFPNMGEENSEIQIEEEIVEDRYETKIPVMVPTDECNHDIDPTVENSASIESEKIQANIPPVADAGEDGQIYEDETHQFDGTNSTEPLKVTTDKYTYYKGEPVHITITGYRVGPTTDFYRGYLIKDEFGHWVRDPPTLHSTDVIISSGPDNYTWHQKYEILAEYDISGNYRIHYTNNGEQVSTGKYYIYPYPGICEPAEIEIIERVELIIEKEKISGPDEVMTHTYNEWELKITVSNTYPQTQLSPISLLVMLHKNVSLEQTVLAIENLGGIVTEKSYPFLKVLITPNLIDDLAHILSVIWMQKTSVIVPFNLTLPTGGGTRGDEEGKYLKLKAGTFDPIYGEPDFLLPILKIEGYNGNIKGYWIVQLKDNMTRDIWDELEALGVDILGYIPDDAYIVRMTNDVKNEVAELSFVRAIVLFQPRYKLELGLMDYKEYFNIEDANYSRYINDVIVHDVLPAELKLLDYELTQGTLTVTKKGKGKMGSTHLTWHVGDLYDKAELILKIATRTNPAGKQEFTSPGKYLLNEGASAKGTDSSTGKNLRAGPTEPIYVTVLENQNHNNKKPHH